MKDLWVHERLLRYAATMGYFFLGNERDVRIAILRAARRLDVALQQQYKRMKSKAKHPSVTNLPSDNLFLAGLLDVMDEVAEKSDRLSGSNLDFMDCTLFFLLSCLRHARHHSFHLAIAIGRILHWYQTAEVRRVYEELLAGDVKEDYQYREIKRDLVQALTNRFGDLVSHCKERNGEDRFVTTTLDEPEWQILSRGLDLLTIWDRSHVGKLSEFFKNDAIGPDLLHRLDRLRMHMLSCPPCFDSVARGASLDPPRKRIAVPLFGGPDGPGTRREEFTRNVHPEWMSVEWIKNLQDDVESILLEERQFRCEWHGGPLKLEIVGASLNRTLWLGRRQSVRMDNLRYSDAIEISAPGRGGRVLLGYTPVNLVGRKHGEIEIITINLGQAHEITLKLSFSRAGVEPKLQISAKYKSLAKPHDLAVVALGAQENDCPQLIDTRLRGKVVPLKNADSRSPPLDRTPQ